MTRTIFRRQKGLQVRNEKNQRTMTQEERKEIRQIVLDTLNEYGTGINALTTISASSLTDGTLLPMATGTGYARTTVGSLKESVDNGLYKIVSAKNLQDRKVFITTDKELDLENIFVVLFRFKRTNRRLDKQTFSEKKRKWCAYLCNSYYGTVSNINYQDHSLLKLDKTGEKEYRIYPHRNGYEVDWNCASASSRRWPTRCTRSGVGKEGVN